MKIITIEEHTIDAGIAKASQPAQATEAGYMTDWGSRVEDNPATHGDNRPHLVAAKTAVELEAYL